MGEVKKAMVGTPYEEQTEITEIARPPEGMTIRERAYYLRHRRYGIKTVGCILMSSLVDGLEKGTIDYPEAWAKSGDLVEALNDMVVEKRHKDAEAESAKTEGK